MPERILLLSYAFPPMAQPEAILSAKTMGSLPGCSVDVVCARRGKAWQGNDESLLDYVQQRFGHIERLRQPLFARAFRFGWLPFLSQIPDIFVYTNPRAVDAALALEPGRCAAMVTWSQWHSVHLVGLQIKRMHPSLRWVAHFSDPWVDNPYVKYGPVGALINARLERAVIAEADSICVTTDYTADLMMRKYPPAWRSKVKVFPHPYDPALYEASASATEQGIVIRHLGFFYGRRTPEPLFVALGRIRRSDPGLLHKVRFELAGNVQPSFLQTEACRALPEGLVTTLGSVDYRTSLSLMSQSDALLVIDAPARTSVFLPSKLVDYIGAGRPVFGITPPGASADLIRELGGWAADPDDANAVAEGLARLLRLLQDGALPRPWGSPGVRARYSTDVVGAAFARHLLEGRSGG